MPARDAQLHGQASDVVIDAVAGDHASIDQAVVGGRGRSGGAQGDAPRGGPDGQGRRAAVAVDDRAVLRQVGDAVAVLVRRGRVRGHICDQVRRADIQHNAAGDVAADDDGRAALQQVVGVQQGQGRVAGAGGVAIAGRSHVALEGQPPADVALDVDRVDAQALSRDRTAKIDRPGDVARLGIGDRVVAHGAQRAIGGDRAGQCAFDRDGARIGAFGQDRAAALDQDVAGQGRAADQTQAVAVGTGRDRAVQIAVAVRVGIGVNVVGDRDGPADGDVRCGRAGPDQDRGRSVGRVGHRDAGAAVQIDVVVRIDRDRCAGVHGDGAAGADADVVARRTGGERGDDGRRAGGRNHDLGMRSCGRHQRGKRYRGRKQSTHSRNHPKWTRARASGAF